MKAGTWGIALAAAALLAPTDRASAQSQCRNNLKQIAVTMLQQPVKAAFVSGSAAGGDHMVRGPHRVLLCSDGTSNTMMLTEREEAAAVRGCPAGVASGGFGRAGALARETAAGLEVTIASHEHTGCHATATFSGRMLTTGVRHAIAATPAAQPEPDARRISSATRQGFSSFWRGLSRAEAAALERRLGELEAQAQAGTNVNRQVAVLRSEYPQLFELSTALQRETWHLVGSGGVDEGSVECNGIGWIGINGKVRCIGKLVVKD